MNERTPEAIRDLLTHYTTLLETSLPGFVSGLYIHGSIALGAFDSRRSDIDCTAFLSRHATADDLTELASLHQRVANRHPQWLLEVSYLQWDDLGKVDHEITSPIYHDNKLTAAGNFDVNAVTWWVLHHHGIRLIGPEPGELPLNVEWELLIARMHDNLNRYWASFIRKPQRIAWLLTDFGIEWTVLGVLRQYYSFVAHDITSKTGAGEYALAHLPSRWHLIVAEALRIREQFPSSMYVTKIKRAGEAYNFLRFIIAECTQSLP